MENFIREYILFSSPNHAVWFFMSMLFLITYNIKLIRKDFFDSGFSSNFAVAYFALSIMAYYQVYISQSGSRAFSYHCIWFNALVGLMYLTMFIIKKFGGIDEKKKKNSHSLA